MRYLPADRLVLTSEQKFFEMNQNFIVLNKYANGIPI